MRLGWESTSDPDQVAVLIFLVCPHTFTVRRHEEGGCGDRGTTALCDANYEEDPSRFIQTKTGAFRQLKELHQKP